MTRRGLTLVETERSISWTAGAAERSANRRTRSRACLSSPDRVRTCLSDGERAGGNTLPVGRFGAIAQIRAIARKILCKMSRKMSREISREISRKIPCKISCKMPRKISRKMHCKMPRKMPRVLTLEQVLVFGVALTLAVLAPAAMAADPSGGSASPAAKDEGSFSTAGTPPPTLPPALPPPPVVRWQPPTDLTAADNPNDSGHGILVGWSLSRDDGQLLAYEIWRAPEPGAPESKWLQVGSVPRGSDSYVYQDRDESLKGKPNPKFVPTGLPIELHVRGRAVDGSVSSWSDPSTGVARGNWFHRGKLNILVALVLFAGAVVWFIESAGRGKPLYIREIPGVVAVDEAIGRATEMGRPILFVPGIGTAGDIASIAAFTILSRIARKTAEYQTPLRVPVNDQVMLSLAQEVVREAYVQAGRPEAYTPETVTYLTAMQFPYVAAVNGMMTREKPAANFYMGVFYAESLLLAETGNATGSIQISGTDQVSQIPFFVAATDYTLIGEELYAASAELSRDPKLMGPLKAQDYAKVVIMAAIVTASAALTVFHWDGLVKLFHAV